MGRVHGDSKVLAMSGGFGNPANMSKKESFQIYLEKTGVIDALTKVLLRCFEEPVLPESPLDFIKSYLGVPTGKDDAATNKKIADNNKKIEELKRRRDGLKAQL